MENTDKQHENALRLAEILVSQVPDHEQSWRLRTTPTNQIPHMPKLYKVAEEVAKETAKRKDAVEARTKANLLIIRNLIRCLFENCWLVLPSCDENFKKGEHLHKLGFTRRIAEDAITGLTGFPSNNRKNDQLRKCSIHWMQLGNIGMRIGDYRRASQFRATQKLARIFCDLLYEDNGGWNDNDLYTVDADCTPAEQAHHSKQADLLHRYNDFIQQHSYVLKGPMSRTLNDYPDRGGRIDNAFQNITQRRVPIRQQTLINGETIAEPDFSANHLRMAAYLCGVELPNDPYTHIVERVPGTDRQMVKHVVTAFIGAQDERQYNGMRYKFVRTYQGGSGELYDAIRDALRKEYPWTERVFFKDVGAHLQYLEGEIALRMMAWAMVYEVPLLPVHDSFAVPKRHEAVTEHAMQMSWKVVMKEAATGDILIKAAERAPAMYALKKKDYGP